jgi:hypothetical protein
LNTVALTHLEDIAQRLHLLVLKAKIFAAGGQPIKGFSITLRAASMAERYSLISILTEALGVLSVILNELSEFNAAKDIAEAALPSVSRTAKDLCRSYKLTCVQALENRDLEVSAQLFSHLAESHVGISGTSASGSNEQSRNIRTAEMNVERSYEGKLLTPCVQNLPLPSFILTRDVMHQLTCCSIRENGRRLRNVRLLNHEGQIGTMEGR